MLPTCCGYYEVPWMTIRMDQVEVSLWHVYTDSMLVSEFFETYDEAWEFFRKEVKGND